MSRPESPIIFTTTLLFLVFFYTLKFIYLREFGANFLTHFVRCKCFVLLPAILHMGWDWELIKANSDLAGKINLFIAPVFNDGMLIKIMFFLNRG